MWLISKSLHFGHAILPLPVTHLQVTTKGPSGDNKLLKEKVLMVGLQALCWATMSFCGVRLSHPAFWQGEGAGVSLEQQGREEELSYLSLDHRSPGSTRTPGCSSPRDL